MSKPFQYSLLRLFALMTGICIEVGLFSAATKHLSDADRNGAALVAISCIAVSLFVGGAILRKPLEAVLLGAGVALFLAFGFFINGLHQP